MDIVCCTDNNYVIPCGVLVTSICVNNPKEETTFSVTRCLLGVKRLS